MRVTKLHGAFKVQFLCAQRGAGVSLNVLSKFWRNSGISRPSGRVPRRHVVTQLLGNSGQEKKSHPCKEYARLKRRGPKLECVLDDGKGKRRTKKVYFRSAAECSTFDALVSLDAIVGEDLQHIFNVLDKDCDGRISAADLRLSLRGEGLGVDSSGEPRSATIQSMIALAADGADSLHYATFFQLFLGEEGPKLADARRRAAVVVSCAPRVDRTRRWTSRRSFEVDPRPERRVPRARRCGASSRDGSRARAATATRATGRRSRTRRAPRRSASASCRAKPRGTSSSTSSTRRGADVACLCERESAPS